MITPKALFTKVGVLAASALAFAGSALAVYSPDTMDTTIGTVVTSMTDRITYFITQNGGTIVGVGVVIILLWFILKAARRALGR